MKIFLLLLFWCLWYINFCTRAIIAPVLPIIEQELGISHAAAGGIFSFMATGFTAAVLLSGLFVHRVGFKRSILAGFLIVSIALFLMQYATTYLSISFICLFIGLGAGMYLPSAIPLITEIFGRRNWGKILAIHDSGASFSILFTPILATLALRVVHWRTLFIALAGLCLLFALIFAITSPDVPIQMEKGAGSGT